MSTDTDDVSALEGALDPQITYGDEAITRRKAMLQHADAPLHVLAKAGVDVPHRTYNAENAADYPHSVAIDGTRVSLHQKVYEYEDDDNPFSDDTHVIEWTVVGIDPDEEILELANAGGWDRFRDVSFDDFDDYDPQWVDSPRGREPLWGY
jgi:hypothetical protein